MDHADLYQMRETYNEKGILLCFNGPFSQGLIEEIGNAVKRYLQTEDASASSAMDVFAIYIELAQNIQHYCTSQDYNESDSSATVVIGRGTDGQYIVSAGNVVETSDGEALIERIHSLAAMDRAQLKALYKEQLRKPRDESSHSTGAGLGLIDISRKASAPISASLRPINSEEKKFFSIRVLI